MVVSKRFFSAFSVSLLAGSVLVSSGYAHGSNDARMSFREFKQQNAGLSSHASRVLFRENYGRGYDSALNLASRVKNIKAPLDLSSPVTINNGGVLEIVTARMNLTAAQEVALEQVLSGGKQLIELDSRGAATGGQLTVKSGEQFSKFVVPQGVTVYADFNSTSPLEVGRFSSAGTVNVLSSDSAISDAVIAAARLHNSGTITTGSGSDMNLTLSSPTISNSGIISANNLTINSGGSSLGSLAIDNTGGTLRANHAVNINNAGGVSGTQVSLYGGIVDSQTLNVNAGKGNVLVFAKAINGAVNVDACKANVGTATGSLNLGQMNLSDDPTFYSVLGPIVLTADITIGGPTTLLSGGVINLAGHTIQSTSAGQGADITLIAGALLTPTAGAKEFPNSLSGSEVVKVNGISSTGGSIIDTVGGGKIDASSTGAGLNGGNVVLAAYGTQVIGGVIDLTNTSVTTNSTSARAGNVTILAPNAINLSTINMNGPVGSPTLLAQTSQPTGALTAAADGSVKGSLKPSNTLAQGQITLNNNANIVANAGNVMLVGNSIGNNGVGTLANKIDVSEVLLGGSRSGGTISLNSATTLALAVNLLANGSDGVNGAGGGAGQPGIDGGAGTAGGRITITSGALLSSSATTPSIVEVVGGRGGDGGTGGTATTSADPVGGAAGAGAVGGTGGSIVISASSLDLGKSSVSVDAGAGGNGGKGGNAFNGVNGAGSVGGNGGIGGEAGKAGTISMTASGGSGSLLLPRLSAQGANGGNGGNGGTGGDGITSGGAGGAGGTGGSGSKGGIISLVADTTGGTVALQDFVKAGGGSGGYGGDGGKGGTGGSSSGGSGGAGATGGASGAGGKVTALGANISYDGYGSGFSFTTVSATAGDAGQGGDGGDGNSGFIGGAGGAGAASGKGAAGGSIIFNAKNGDIKDSGVSGKNTLNADVGGGYGNNGGDGGAGGDGNVGAGGAGGKGALASNGGKAGSISLTASKNIITGESTIGGLFALGGSVGQGGFGGAGGDATATDPNAIAGNGAVGGSGAKGGAGGKISIKSGGSTTFGGFFGLTVDASGGYGGSAGSGGDGGDATLGLSGGDGGASGYAAVSGKGGSVKVIAGGGIDTTNIGMFASAGPAGSGGSGGNAGTGGSVGGNAGAAGDGASSAKGGSITMKAGGDINNASGSLTASGSFGGSGGTGGSGGGGASATSGAVGGDGGAGGAAGKISVKSGTLINTGSMSATGELGGDGGYGGTGGNNSATSFPGGDGGNGGNGGPGGNGGSVSRTAPTVNSPTNPDVTGGGGGAGGNGGSPGGGTPPGTPGNNGAVGATGKDGKIK